MNSASRGLRPTGRLYASNEFDLEGLRPTVGLRRPKKSALRGEGRFQSAQSLRPTVGFTRRMNSTSRASADGQAYADRKILFASAKADALARQRLRRPISIGAKAFGQRSACADRKILSASAKADTRRASASEGRFQSAQSLRPAVGLCAE
jgi:hypothetical protein